MSDRARIVFTAAGAICGAGLSVEEIWDAIQNGRSAVSRIRRWDPANWSVQIAAEIHGVSNRTLVDDRKLHKMLSRTDMLGLYAAGQAIELSGLLDYRNTLHADEAGRFNDRTGVFAGSGGGSYQCNYDFFPLLTEAGGSLDRFGQELGSTVNPMWLLKNLPNNVLCHVGIRHGFKGTNACVTNQCLGGVAALGEAANALREGEADRAVVAGHDTALDIETLVNFDRIGLLAKQSLRPFDENRDGTVLGEGAAAFVLETREEATARGATPLGAFLGSAITTEATGVVNVRPDGDGVTRAIQLALQDAALSPEDIGMVVAHGNGTLASDASEVMALRNVFGGRIPPVTGFKWSLGHTFAASGVLDLALTLRALQENVVPGIPTLRTLDPALAPLPVTPSPQRPLAATALLICRGFGGMNLAMIVHAASGASGA